jgi:hypothetical protein
MLVSRSSAPQARRRPLPLATLRVSGRSPHAPPIGREPEVAALCQLLSQLAVCALTLPGTGSMSGKRVLQ